MKYIFRTIFRITYRYRVYVGSVEGITRGKIRPLTNPVIHNNRAEDSIEAGS